MNSNKAKKMMKTKKKRMKIRKKKIRKKMKMNMKKIRKKKIRKKKKIISLKNQIMEKSIYGSSNKAKIINLLKVLNKR